MVNINSTFLYYVMKVPNFQITKYVSYDAFFNYFQDTRKILRIIP